MLKHLTIIGICVGLCSCDYVPIKTGPTRFSQMPAREFTRKPPPVRQGVFIEQKHLNELEVGFTKQQVKYVLGTPHTGLFDNKDRWYYLYYFEDSEIERVIVHFKNEKLINVETNNGLVWSPTLAKSTPLPKTVMVSVPEK